jgi:hypothetical protein
MNIQTITQSYIECALWLTCDDAGNPVDTGVCDVSAELAEDMESDVADFLAYLEANNIPHDEWTDEQLGHDLWLTRNGHGAGFWDRGLPQGEALTAAAKTFGPVELYVGDDGNLYC